MKKYLVFLILALLLGVSFLYRKEIVAFYIDHFIKEEQEITLTDKNQYSRSIDFAFVQKTNSFIPRSLQDLKNIYYTVIDAGKTNFTFYCPDDYKNCLSDVKYLANNQTLLSHINNFVHPFNGFKHVSTEYDSLGKISIHVERTYSDEKIKAIEQKVDTIASSLLVATNNKEENIKLVHDYLIKNTKYDSLRSDSKITKYESDTAYGPLFEGYGLCGGYTDSMALFLDRLGIKNYKVSSENHVWNAVFLGGKWFHLDLTWDDPITSDGQDILEYNFFLITTEELQAIEDAQHNFDTTIYQELK